MFRGTVTLQTVNYVKNGLIFVLCFIVAFWLARYGMPLYPVTAWGIDHVSPFFSQYQADVYEAGADPATFTSLMLIIGAYALIFFLLVKTAIKKIRGYFLTRKTKS